MLLKQNHLLGLLILGSVAAAEPALATVNSGTSEGYGIGPITGSGPGLFPQPEAWGSAPAPYTSWPPSVLNRVYISDKFIMSAAEAGSLATSYVDGLPGVRTTTATSYFTNVQTILHFGQFGNSGMNGLLYLTVAAGSSMSEVTGEYGSLTPFGVSNLTNSSLIFDPSLEDAPDIVFNLPGEIAPNTDLFSLLLTPGHKMIRDALLFSGYKIILNELSGSCNGINFCAIGVRAIHIYGVNDATFGLSNAKQTAVVPEASTSGMMLAGLGLVGAMVARRRKHTQAVALT